MSWPAFPSCFPIVQIDDVVPESPAATLEFRRWPEGERIVAQIRGIKRYERRATREDFMRVS
jgi:hypothetical protein